MLTVRDQPHSSTHPPTHQPHPHMHSTIDLPLPTHRLASTALQALQVDAELSPLVQRTLSLVISSADGSDSKPEGDGVGVGVRGGGEKGEEGEEEEEEEEEEEAVAIASGGCNVVVLRTQYRATTNRMLRVAVNGYMESLGVVLGVMEELDVDVLGGTDA
jgi:EKC/KEOPS complex subunit PCC1/LAGE3